MPKRTKSNSTDRQNAEKIKRLKAQADANVKAAREAAKIARQKAAALRKSIEGDKRKYKTMVARLKKAGIISKRVDARKAKPSRSTTATIIKYLNVAQNKAVVRKAKKPLLKKVKEAGGLQTFRNKVIVPRAKGERVTMGKESIFKTSNVKRMKMRSEIILVPFTTLEDWLNEKEKVLDSLPPSFMYGFRIYGNDGYRAFHTPKGLMDYLRKYLPLIDDTEEQLVGNLEITNIEDERTLEEFNADSLRRQAERIERQKERQKIYQREYQKRRRRTKRELVKGRQ